jgi:Flavodoxin-like fold
MIMKKKVPIHALVIVCHPDHKSFNHALANASITALRARGFSVNLRDLYAEKSTACWRPRLFELARDLDLIRTATKKIVGSWALIS